MHAPVSPRRHITVTSIQQIQNWPIRFILASWSFHFSQVFTPNFIKNYWPGLKYNQSGRCTLLRWTFSYKFHQIKVTCVFALAKLTPVITRQIIMLLCVQPGIEALPAGALITILSPLLSPYQLTLRKEEDGNYTWCERTDIGQCYRSGYMYILRVSLTTTYMYKVIKDKDRFALSLGETSQLISMHYVSRLHRALIFFTIFIPKRRITKRATKR